MENGSQVFKYPRSRKLAILFVFFTALLFPIIIALIGFLAVITVPPRLEIHEALSRLYHFLPNLMERNPASVPLLFFGLWMFFVVGILPKAITYSLVVTVGDQGIGASLLGLRVRYFFWREVDRIEEATALEYEGKWQTIRVVRIHNGKKRLTIRESILDFGYLVQLVRENAARYQILFV